jgi:uncharacterized membrane protein|tara:strand:- start:105 stop:587 length:483 start_codon:yes stop_codon:yes gene_type:complete
MKKKPLQILVIVSFLALIVSAHLLYLHYSSEDSYFCNLDNLSGCNVVNKSVYSTTDGVINNILGTHINFPFPTALLSLLVFAFIFAGSYSLYQDKSFFKISRKKLITYFQFLLVISLIYALFLIYIEAYVLNVWCVFCLVLDVLILISLMAVSYLKNSFK